MSVINLSKEELQRFHMNTLDEYKADFGDSLFIEIEYYETFLIRTDYIVLKMAEAKILEVSLNKADMNILTCRSCARDRINELQDEIKSISNKGDF